MLSPLDARQRAARRAGFTLSELLIATAAMAFVLIYTLGTFTANRNTYVVIENVSEAHQNTLAIASLVERDVRNAGYMVPEAATACGVDATTGPDLLFVSDAEAIRTAENLPATLAGGNLSARPLSGSLPGSWSASTPITLNDVAIDGEDTYDTDTTVGPDSDFRRNGGVIITDLDDPDNGVWCGLVVDVDAGANRINVSISSPTNPPATGNWALVPAVVYAINGSSLTRNGTVMARNVEDLQLAWFYDLDEDGQLDAGENMGSGAGGPDLDMTDIGGVGGDPALLRELRFNLVVRTAENDPNDPTSAGIGQARENRTSPPPADGRRRRVHTSTIRLRNLV